MVYARRSRRTRGGRRTRKTLSNYRIATRTGARAQSKQIYALKKRVNAVYKLAKPVIQIVQYNTQAMPNALNPNTNGFVMWASTSNTDGVNYIIPPTNNLAITSPAVNTALQKINRVNLRQLHIGGMIEYNVGAQTLEPTTVRITVFQLKQSRGQGIGVSDIFSSGSSGTSFLQQVYGPLQQGVSKTCKILSDKTYTITTNRQQVRVNTNLRYLRNYYIDANSANTTSSSTADSSENVFAGTIHVVYSIYSQGSGQVDVNLNAKLVYSI